jgi:hypothetical protein
MDPTDQRSLSIALMGNTAAKPPYGGFVMVVGHL